MSRRQPEDPAPVDTVALRTAWNRLIALVNEQAASLQRTAFSNVVREAGDLSAGIFDTRSACSSKRGSCY